MPGSPPASAISSDCTAGVVAAHRYPGLCEVLRRRAGHARRHAVGLALPARRISAGRSCLWARSAIGAVLSFAGAGLSPLLLWRRRGRGRGFGGAARRAFSRLALVGTETPPFREPTVAEDVETARRIDPSGADSVWVGLSTPKQDLWMARQRERLAAPVLIGIGGAFDNHSARKRQAAYWPQRSGFEWLYRLAAEARRLLWRYATSVPEFLRLAVLQHLGLREFPLDRQ
jgi:hypothetical protein